MITKYDIFSGKHVRFIVISTVKLNDNSFSPSFYKTFIWVRIIGYYFLSLCLKSITEELGDLKICLDKTEWDNVMIFATNH